jgi:hypothetical protein
VFHRKPISEINSYCRTRRAQGAFAELIELKI